MSNYDIHLELDSLVRDIEYCRLENIRFEPDTNSFQFIDGMWSSDHTNFPIDEDNVLDIMIIVTGNPGTTCTLSIRIDTNTPTKYESYEPFSDNGRSFFSLKVSV